jgi:hypothetical protein
MLRLLLVILMVCGVVAAASAETNSATVVGANRLVVRRGPGKQFPPFASLTEGSKVEVEEVKGEWARIVTGNGQRGYVHSNFLSIAGELPAATPAAGEAAAEPARAAAEPPVSRPGVDRTRALESELKAVNEAKKSLEAELHAASDRAKALEAELKGATDRSKALEGEEAALRERAKSLDADLQAARQEIAELKSRANPAAATGEPRGGAENIGAELARLAAAVDALQSRVGSAPLASGVAAGERPAGATSQSPGSEDTLLSPTAVLIGLLGIVVGWFLGGTVGRKQDRGRRARIRF